MSDQSTWKMLHLLRLYARDDGTGDWTLSGAELDAAGVDCFSDTIQPAINGLAVERSSTGRFRLGSGARVVLDQCVVGNKRWSNSREFRVDYPSVFVIMPFSEAWSNRVWDELITPAIEQAGLACVRGDMAVRVTDLTNTVWNEIISAGLVLADLSSPNVNVFYELGLAHALGKDTFILKQGDVTLAADFRGAHIYAYDRAQPADAVPELVEALQNWATEKKIAGVVALDRPAP
jgi:hypothetical protein